MRRTRQPLPTLPQIVAHRMGKWTTCEQAIDAMRAERTEPVQGALPGVGV